LRALNLKSARELERRAESWRPWRAYAAIHLWNMASAGATTADSEDRLSTAFNTTMVARSA
jgi:3-methyladenine DNA glycosylase/8-oxoguanine DNA glycosylase